MIFTGDETKELTDIRPPEVIQEYVAMDNSLFEAWMLEAKTLVVCIFCSSFMLDLQQVSLAAVTGEGKKVRETCNTWLVIFMSYRAYFHFKNDGVVVNCSIEA